MWDWDITTGNVAFNDRSAEMLGYRPEELKLHVNSWKKLVHPDDISKATTILVTHLKGQSSAYEAEYRMRAKNGEWKWFLDKGKVMERNAEGRALRMAGTHLDITHRKAVEAERIELERKLQKAQKRESLNLMAGGIAHHFNNLLTVVLGNIEVAKLNKDLSIAANQALQEAENAAKRAADMSRLLRTYVGQGRRQKIFFDIGGHIRELVPLIRSSMPQNVTMETNVPSEPLFIEGDPGEIHQVVMNLTANAWEAVGESWGVVGVFVYSKMFDEALLRKNVTASLLRAGEYVCLKVTDTGVGMTEETTAKIFDPFFSTKFAGRGLGLAVTQGIVQGCRGGIFVSSQPGSGCQVEILFPAATNSLEIDKQQTATDTDKGRAEGAVLLVDDEEMLLTAVSAILQCLGFQVITATSGHKAIEVFEIRRNSIRCVILDLTMPDMDGWQTLDALRRIEPGVCAILSTGYDVVELQEESRDVQPDGWVQKPYQLPQLQQELERCLRQSRGQVLGAGC